MLLWMICWFWFCVVFYVLVGVGIVLFGVLLCLWLFEGVVIQIGVLVVGNIFGIFVVSMLMVIMFLFFIMVFVYSMVGSSVMLCVVILLVEDFIVQCVLVMFIGVFLFSVVGLIVLSIGVYGDSG